MIAFAVAILQRIYHRVLDRLQPPAKVKTRNALRHWQIQKSVEGDLTNDHFEYFFTTHFGLDKTFYAQKKILDIGCGPRGSLEWAEPAATTMGLDPLVDEYCDFGIADHRTAYVAALAEDMPFPDGYFDVVSAFNSFDHVDDLSRVISDIDRVLAPGGHYLLLTDIHHKPTTREPQTFSWDVIERFPRHMTATRVTHFEKAVDGIYQSIQHGQLYDHADKTPRYGILSALFVKQA